MSKTERAERRDDLELESRGNVVPFRVLDDRRREAGLWYEDALHWVTRGDMHSWQSCGGFVKDVRRFLDEWSDPSRHALLNLGDQGGSVLVYWVGSALGYSLQGYARAASAKQLRKTLLGRGWDCVVVETNPSQIWDFWPRELRERVVPAALRIRKVG